MKTKGKRRAPKTRGSKKRPQSKKDKRKKKLPARTKRRYGTKKKGKQTKRKGRSRALRAGRLARDPGVPLGANRFSPVVGQRLGDARERYAKAMKKYKKRKDKKKKNKNKGWSTTKKLGIGLGLGALGAAAAWYAGRGPSIDRFHEFLEDHKGGADGLTHAEIEEGAREAGFSSSQVDGIADRLEEQYGGTDNMISADEASRMLNDDNFKGATTAGELLEVTQGGGPGLSSVATGNNDGGTGSGGTSNPATGNNDGGTGSSAPASTPAPADPAPTPAPTPSPTSAPESGGSSGFSWSRAAASLLHSAANASRRNRLGLRY